VKTKDHHFTNANCELFYFKFSSYIFKLKINLGIFGPKKSQMNDICFKLLSTVIVISKCSWNTSYDEKWKQLKTLAFDQNYLKWPFVMIVRFFIWIEKSFLIEKNIFFKIPLEYLKCNKDVCRNSNIFKDEICNKVNPGRYFWLTTSNLFSYRSKTFRQSDKFKV